MDTAQRLAAAGALLGGGAGLFLLGKAAAAGPTLESVVPGLLALAFAVIGGWGGYSAGVNSKKRLRGVLGAALGGLVAADLFFIPAAFTFVTAGYLIWRSSK